MSFAYKSCVSFPGTIISNEHDERDAETYNELGRKLDMWLLSNYQMKWSSIDLK